MVLNLGLDALEDPDCGGKVVYSSSSSQSSSDDGGRWYEIVGEGIVEVALEKYMVRVMLPKWMKNPEWSWRSLPEARRHLARH